MALFNLPRPLTPDVAREHRDQLLTLLLDTVKQVSETDEGFVLNFGRLDEELAAVVQFLEVERKCNPFLRLRLTLESNEGPVRLRLSGPSGTKDFLIKEFGLNRWLANP